MGEERLDYLERVGSTDPQLRAEVAKLLDDAESASSFMNDPAFALHAESAAAPQRALQPGQVLNERFEIESFLGAGGMGEVYAASDRELGERVAIKTLPPHIAANPAFVSRLRRELKLARRVSHPNICRVFDVNQSVLPSGAPVVYLTMELLAGRTLAEIVRAHPFAEREAAPVAQQILDGVGAAHRAGIVHRDLKSSNVILTGQAGGGWRAVITDFGLSRDAASPADATDTLGAAGILGTPVYMAPEQLRDGRASTLSDIYSIGLVLFEMVTGRLPFAGSTPIAAAMKRMHARSPSPRQWAADLSRNWERTILACLEHDPASRPHSCLEVSQMLAGERRAPIARRKLAAAAAVALVASAAGLGLWAPWRRTLHPEAVRSFLRGEEFAKRRSDEDLKNAIQEYGQAVRLEPGYAVAWAGLAHVYAAMGNFGYRDARASLAQARRAAEEAVRLDPRLARAQGVLGYVTSITLPVWRTAGPYFERAVELDPADPNVRLWYGAYLGKLGRFDEAIAQLKTGLERHPEVFLLNHQLAASYFLARRDADFARQCRELVRLQPFEAAAHLMLARSLQTQGKYEEALKRCEEAQKYRNSVSVRCVRAMIEADRGDMAAARNTAAELEAYWRSHPFETALLAGLLARVGRVERALDLLEQAYEFNDSSLLSFIHIRYADPLRDQPRFRRLAERLGLGAMSYRRPG